MGVGPPEVAVDLEPPGTALCGHGDGRLDESPADTGAAMGLVDDQGVKRADRSTLVQLSAHDHNGHPHDVPAVLGDQAPLISLGDPCRHLRSRAGVPELCEQRRDGGGVRLPGGTDRDGHRPSMPGHCGPLTAGRTT